MLRPPFRQVIGALEAVAGVMRAATRSWLGALSALALWVMWSAAPAVAAQTSAEADDRERAVIERFQGVLEKNPRRGTALDRLYGYHVERGTLAQLVAQYRERTEQNPADGSSWMILGLIESQRGRDAAAVEAFREAEKHLADNALPLYYLGQSLVLVGQPDAAAEAFERAIERRPSRTDLLEVFQALGRVYQRAHRNEQAIGVWSRLEQLFPEDLRVQEQIAGTLAEEDQHAEALKRYESLARLVKDDEYREVTFRMQAAELKVRLGQSAAALEDFENLLGRLNPDSWLFREVRRRIEEVFLRNDDLAGLADYYNRWLQKNTDDVDGMTRLARTLANLGRAPESQEWYDKAIKLAPSRKELRLSLIEQFVRQQKYREAIEQYEALDKAEPNNPDTIREWGRLILKEASHAPDERKTRALAVWRRLVDAKPKDPVVHTQVADLLRHAELTDEAIAHYEKAIELAPDAPQYREYLGEYYHTLKRPDDALTTWRQMVAGGNRTPKNLTRLAEVLAGFGYRAEAIEAITEANRLEPDEFERQLKLADLLHQAERFDDAVQQLNVVMALASDDEQKVAVLDHQIKNYQALDRLPGEIEALQNRLKSGADATAEDWRRLARYLEASRNLPEAVGAIQRAIELDQTSIQSWSVAARLHESSGNLLAAADANRKLAAIDRRARTEFLTNVARIETRLGRRDAAMQAGRDLIASAPGNPEHYQFFAELCFQLGDSDEGFESLRRAARVNPSDPQALLTLAAALAERFRTDEAIELFWQSFDKAQDLDAKLGIVSSLAASYLQLNQFDRLVERLSRLRNEAKEPREMTICLAQAYQSAQDFGTARQELERLLSMNTRDTKLLGQLSHLAETERDYAAAAKYQRQLNEVAPSKEGDARLAILYMRSGEGAEAETIWTQLATGDQEPHRAIEAINSLLSSSKYDTVLTLTERLLRESSGDWELLYREAVALFGLERYDDCSRRLQELLALRTADDEKSAVVKARMKGSGRPAGSLAAATSRQPFVPSSPAMDRINAAHQIRMATGLETRFMYSYSSQAAWSPADFGQARMAALAWLFRVNEKKGEHEQWIAQLQQAAEQAGADTRPQWDMYYLQLVRQEQKATYEAAKLLSKSTEPAARWAYLMSLAGRAVEPGAQPVSRGDAGQNVDKTPPLDGTEIDHMLACFQSLQHAQQEWSYQGVLGNVTAELKRANRTELEEKIYRDGLESATHVDTMYGFLNMAAARGDMDGAVMLLDRMSRNPVGRSRYGYNFNPLQQAGQSLGQLMMKRADAKTHADVARVFDRYFAAVREHQKSAPPARSSTFGNPYSGGRAYYQIWTGGQYGRSIQIDYPQPNEYFDYFSIQLLRNAFELYKRDDLLTDLFAHFRKQAEELPDPERVFPRLALAFMYWWNEEKDQSIAQLVEAAALRPDDLSLHLELAEIRERHGQPEEALAIVESIQPVDNNIMKRREIIAMRVAVATGNVERARQSAERLFGLQLESDLQMQLASQMNQLGMHELADAVLSRARRRSGNRTDSLVLLMQQYQSQNKPEIATQIAYQILRTTSTQSRGPGYRTSDDVGRDAAIQILARSGKLLDMIARTEAQLKTSPNSIQLHEILADYFRAAGQREKALETYERMITLRPDDARLRFQIASQLVQTGDAAKAIEHYRIAFKKEPMLFTRAFWEVQNTYQRANKLDELVKLLEEIDLRSLGSYSYVTNVIQQLAQNEKTREQGLSLFRKAWKAYPNERRYLMSSIYNEEIWKLPEMYDYAREGVIPPPSQTHFPAWNGLDYIYSWSGDGKVTAVATRLLEAATKQNKTDVLAKDISEALERAPDWSGGKALLAILQVRQGQLDSAKKSLEALLADDKSRMPASACWIIGQELENFGPLSDLSMKIYEKGVKSEESDTMEFSYHPARRLLGLYQRSGRTSDGHELILKFAKRPSQYEYDAQYAAYRKLNDLNALADAMLQLGYPADAVRFYSELLGDTERRDLARRFYGDRDYVSEQAQQGLNRAIQSLSGEATGRTMQQLLKAQDARTDSEPAIDLVLLVLPRELDRTTITSILASAIQQSVRNVDRMAEVGGSLRRLLDENPQDIAVHVIAALHALAMGQTEPANEKSAADAVSALVQLVESQPLEELPEGTRANARQRAEAAKQLPLWLVARECWKHESLRSAGDTLAARALDAARRQTDSGWILAMYRELGQFALDRGDRVTAEKHWSQMLEVIIPKPVPKPTAPPKPGSRAGLPLSPLSFSTVALVSVNHSGEGQGAAVPPPTTSRPAGPPPATTRPTPQSASAGPAGALVPPLTLDRFEQVARLAKLAAENKMHTLSLRAVTEATRGGPPIAKPDGGRFGAPAARSGIVSANPVEEQTIGRQVHARLAELDQIWRQSGAPAAEVYETLAGIVLPEARPADVFLYAVPLTETVRQAIPGGTRLQPRSVGAVVSRWAATAGASDEFMRRIESRQDQPLAQLPSRILLAQAALAAGNTERATQALTWLADRLQKDTLQNTAELASHAAMPALSHRETSDVAMRVMDLAAANMTGQANVSEEPIASLWITLARMKFDRNNPDEAKKCLEEFLRAVDRSLARYVGDYAPYRRKLAMQRMAIEYARSGLLEPALEMLGQVADVPRSRYSEQPIGSLLGFVASELSSRPAADRYELLRAWSLPTATRNSIRMVGTFAPSDGPPVVFQKSPHAWRLPLAVGYISSLQMLVDAARDAGKLDDLAATLQKLHDDKVENAMVAFLLTEIARGGGESVEPIVAEMFTAFMKRKQETNRQELDLWPDFLVASACLNDPRLVSQGVKLADELIKFTQRNYSGWTFAANLRAILSRHAASRHGAADSMVGNSPRLSLWQPAGHATGASRQLGALPNWWFAHEGSLCHVFGPEFDFLYYTIPLRGTFQISLSAYKGPSFTSNVSYGGVVVEPSGDAAGKVFSMGHHESISLRQPFARDSAFARFTIQVQPDKVRFLVNGHLYYEDKQPSAANPWFALNAWRAIRAEFRDFRIEGQPEIPREVQLVHADRLDGWISNFYGESKPQSGRLRQPEAAATGASMPTPAMQPSVVDWSAQDGVIAGRRSEPAPLAEPSQSRLYYHRPLCNGERLRYEFYYEPEKVMVYPALDRLAFLLDPEGVKLHWMTDASDLDWSGLRSDNAEHEPSNRRGPERLPLRPGEWNTVELSLTGDTLGIALNGTQIYERELEPSNDRLFGFFFFKDRTSAQVRNVVLRGDWPEQFVPELFTDLTRRSTNPTLAERKALSEIMGESTQAAYAGNVLRQARELGAADRYEYLRRWVLPSEDHATWRLYGHSTPTDPVPASVANDPSAATGLGRRQQIGGTLEAPVLELVSIARKLGKLEELAANVGRCEAATEADVRAKRAFELLLLIAQGQDDAVPAFTEFRELVGKMALDAPVEQRWPEMLVAQAAMQRPKLLATSLELLDFIVVEQLQAGKLKKITPERADQWEREVRHLRARAQVLTRNVAPSAFGELPPSSVWSPVVFAKANSRGRGAGPAHWIVQKDELRHFPGHDHDYLYLNTPFRGDFVLDCELTSFGWREAQVCYGGLRFGVLHDRKTLELSAPGRHLRNVGIDPPLEKIGDWYAFRLAVADRQITATVHDREIVKESLPAGHDPWLALHCLHWCSGAVRNLKITGNVTIPESLDLSNQPDLSGWLSYFDEPLGGNNQAWEKRGDEIFGRTFSDLPGSKEESILQYHRPMLENGTMEYEFYYESGKALTHPALDRLVFQLDKDGVNVHWLTDGKHDRTGLPPDNVIVEPGNRRGPQPLPLKDKAWNRMQLAMHGDTATLRLNDVVIYERTLEATNQRTFGLFHFADETEVRVRNVSYRGDWPKQLPDFIEIIATKTAAE